MNHSLGIFERNGYFYMRYVVPTAQQKLFNGRTRLVKSLHTKSLKEARVADPEPRHHPEPGQNRTPQRLAQFAAMERQVALTSRQ